MILKLKRFSESTEKFLTDVDIDGANLFTFIYLCSEKERNFCLI